LRCRAPPLNLVEYPPMLISTNELTKRYGAVTALDSLSVEIEPGIIGLLGPNGAGKSTFFKILLGLIEATAGEAEVLGHDIREHTELRHVVGYMPEHDCLPNDVSATAMVSHFGEISGLPYSAARERTSEVLRHVGLLEERYREISTYSTGMKQRAKLAQALVHDPPLLFLDEPTNGLDPAGRIEMLDLIKRTGRELGISIVMSSHLLDDVEAIADFIVLIERGRLLRAGPMDEFLAETPVLIVETDEGEDRLAEALSGRGLSARREGTSVLIDVDTDEAYDHVVDTLVALDLPLIRMERRRRSLVDLFAEPDVALEAESTEVPVG
jgi:ABC-2 type transport system ATP-binding protein